MRQQLAAFGGPLGWGGPTVLLVTSRRDMMVAMLVVPHRLPPSSFSLSLNQCPRRAEGDTHDHPGIEDLIELEPPVG